MQRRHDLFHLISLHLNELDEPSFYEMFLSNDEDCPYCDEVYTGMQKGVTLYREETIQMEVPSEVHFRLHKVIRRQWVQMFDENENNGV